MFPKYFANSPNGINDGMLSGKSAEENVNKSPYGISSANTGCAGMKKFGGGLARFVNMVTRSGTY